ncbi:hypothetical protein IFR04_014736 [Cadophora malorum]|uniref:Heterokaryon incompatibility domain-containing protein n=1 Tax=Cadophora malorum TaxID=108018 RepID=A0A8H7T4C6_9HELO|nr:hypothetical protein IFR04_014736 [Cadophora malorum]
MVDGIRTLKDMTYTSLANTVNTIRLIRLSPQSYYLSSGTPSDILQCELIHAVRGRCPSYTAVSYAWGKTPTTSLLIIGRQRYEVSINVEQVLRQLQHKENDTYVWVDQICINQQDDAEKSDQVQQMRFIYSEAEMVIAWLGPTANGSDMLLKHIERMGEAIWADSEESVIAAHRNQEGLELIGRAFRYFCERDYWQRMWIIQEFTVGRQLCVACGEVMLKDWNLQALLVFIDRLSLNSPPVTSPHRETEQFRHAIVHAYDTPARSFMEGVTTRRFRYWNPQTQAEDSLFRLLVTTLVLEQDYNQTLTTDPRDRIFSVLTLAKDAKEFVKFPDYSLTCEEVYREAALVILNQGQIDILSYCQFPRQASNLPTWAPDWRDQIRVPCCGTPWSNTFHASPDSLSRQNISVLDQYTIALHGVFVDSIEEYSDKWDPHWLKPLDSTAALNYLKDVRELCFKSDEISTSDEDSVAAQVAIAADNSEGDERDRSYYANIWRAVVERLERCISSEAQGMPIQELQRENVSIGLSVTDHEVEDQLSSRWYTAELQRLHSRRPFLSKAGRVGLAPQNSQRCDQICIFAGGKVPYIIRPMIDGSTSFRLVGEAYIHGIMYGEYFQNNLEAAMESITLR